MRSSGIWDHAVAAIALGTIKRLVGALDDRRGTVPLPERRDTNRDRDIDLARALLDRERLRRDPPAQPLRHARGDGHIGFRHDHHELLAAITAGEIDAADRLADAQREFTQHVVAGIMAPTV